MENENEKLKLFEKCAHEFSYVFEMYVSYQMFFMLKSKRRQNRSVYFDLR